MCTTKVLVDANFLVNVNDEDKKLLELMEEYHQVLKITVVLDCLAKVCDDHEKLLSDRLENRIKVISIDSLKDSECESILTLLNSVEHWSDDYDSRVEMAFYSSSDYTHILTDKSEHFEKADKHTKVKVLRIHELEELLKQPPNPPETVSPNPPESVPPNSIKERWESLLRTIESLISLINSWIKSIYRSRKVLGLILLAVIVCLCVIFFHRLSFQNYCPLYNDEFISCGEKILTEETNASSEVFDKYAKNPVDYFKDSNYKDSVENFILAFKQNPTTEILIYLNNALLEVNKKSANTLAVAVTISKSKGNATDEERDLAKEILRGVAQVQTLVNICLFPDDLDFLPESITIKTHNDFCDRIKDKDKGLRIVIVDDVNDKDKANILADKLHEFKKKSILAVIGHNSSDLSIEVIPKYNQNKLVLISPGSSSEIDSLMKDDFFFRTVPTITYEVQPLVEYMNKKNLKNAAVFYNGDSNFSQPLFEKFNKEFVKKGGKVVKKFVGRDNDNTSFTKDNFDI